MSGSIDGKKRVLVTGVAGFIGSQLAARLLAAGYEVVGIDNLAYGRREQVPTGTDFRELDIRSEDIYPAFADVDTVFHLAAKNDLNACQRNPVETMDINVSGMANVLEAAKRAKVRKVVFSSSSVLEEGERRLKGFYAISKIAGEKLIDAYAAAFGMQYTTLRYFNVFGPGQDFRRSTPPIMSLFMIKVLKNERPTLYASKDVDSRDFIYVDDINDFHLQCITDNRTNGNLFRLGRGEAFSMSQIWEAVKKITSSGLASVVVPDPAGFTYASTLADTAEAAALGWKAKTSVEDGLKAQWEYLKKEFAKRNIK